MKYPFWAFVLASLVLSAVLVSCNGSKADEGDPVIENIFERKSVRSFDVEKQVSDEELELLVKAGMAAPSAMNLQPWQFFVSTDKQQMAQLAGKLPYANMLESAAAVIVVLGNPDISPFWYLDCSASTQNILLTAEAMELGAVWVASYPDEDRISTIQEVLGIPEPWTPLALIPVGCPAGEHWPKDKWDPAKVHYNKW